MAPHSSTLAWKIPWMEEPGMLASNLHWSPILCFSRAAKTIRAKSVKILEKRSLENELRVILYFRPGNRC